jgi:hypothetical protein
MRFWERHVLGLGYRLKSITTPKRSNSDRQGKARHAKLLVEGRKYCCGTSRTGTKLQGNLHFGARFRPSFGGCFGRYRGDEKFPLCIKASLPELQVTVWIHSGHLAKQSTSNQFTSSSFCTPSERVHHEIHGDQVQHRTIHSCAVEQTVECNAMEARTI